VLARRQVGHFLIFTDQKLIAKHRMLACSNQLPWPTAGHGRQSRPHAAAAGRRSRWANLDSGRCPGRRRWPEGWSRRHRSQARVLRRALENARSCRRPGAPPQSPGTREAKPTPDAACPPSLTPQALRGFGDFRVASEDRAFSKPPPLRYSGRVSGIFASTGRTAIATTAIIAPGASGESVQAISC